MYFYVFLSKSWLTKFILGFLPYKWRQAKFWELSWRIMSNHLCKEYWETSHLIVIPPSFISSPMQWFLKNPEQRTQWSGTVHPALLPILRTFPFSLPPPLCGLFQVVNIQGEKSHWVLALFHVATLGCYMTVEFIILLCLWFISNYPMALLVHHSSTNRTRDSNLRIVKKYLLSLSHGSTTALI